MSESREDRIKRLLAEGLDLYGVDEVSAAIVTWQKVLEVDPGNAEALDYMRTADRRKVPRPEKGADLSSAKAALVQEARLLLRQGDCRAAFDLLDQANGAGFGDLEYEATRELARSRLYGAYRDRVGDFGQVPRLRSDAGSLTKYNLPANAGFVLSMVDGTTSLADVISLSGMDPFEALHTLDGLMDVGLVEIGAA